jgi:hypothetical protein
VFRHRAAVSDCGQRRALAVLAEFEVRQNRAAASRSTLTPQSSMTFETIPKVFIANHGPETSQGAARDWK